MFEAIKQLGVPRGILDFIGGIYETVNALSSSGNLLFKVASGVLQGCQLSGALFAASVDPILTHLSSIVDAPLCTVVPRTHPLPTGKLAACADDIGGALASIRVLGPLCRAFMIAERVTNLKVNPAKCVIVPVCSCAQEANSLVT